MREKNRTNRRNQSLNAETDDIHNELSPMSSVQSPNDSYVTQEQLAEILLEKLDDLFYEVIGRLVALGYHPGVAMNAVLKNGYYYGDMDVMTNVLNNSMAYLKNGNVVGLGFIDLRHLEEWSLIGMVSLVQQVKPHLSKGDAMWCLLESDLHVGLASTMDIPIPCVKGGKIGVGTGTSTSTSTIPGVGGRGSGHGCSGMCGLHGGCGFGNRAANEFHEKHGIFPHASESWEIYCPKRFNLTPSIESLLKSKITAFASAFKGSAKHSQNQSQASCHCSLPGGEPSSGSVSGFEDELGKSDESQNLKNQEVVNSVLSYFLDLNLDESSEQSQDQDQDQDQLYQKDEMILSLLHQIKDLEKQMKERKDWAHKKAMQATRKLSMDVKELERLRMEREETQRLKKGNQAMEDTTMKRLTYMETALRKARGQVDLANLAVKKLETENAEIRAEMESCKLSASESATIFMEVVKREKKCLKKLGAWEKLKAKLQGDIAAEKLKISDLQQQLVEVEAAQKEAEVKWRLELKAKEQALVQVEEERHFKEVAEASNKRKLQALCHKIEIDFQRHKDDLQQLEQDLPRLKASAQTTELPKGDVAWMVRDFDRLEDSSEKDVSVDRECLICMNDEVSVVFLPCAHQVLCANCNNNYGKKGRATCPRCRVPIEQRICVFGATSYAL